MNRFILPVVFIVDVAFLCAYLGWHVAVLRWLVWAGLGLIGVLVVVDTVLEQRAS